VARAAAARWDGAEGASVIADVDGRALPAQCPPDDVARALDALVENAIRYGGGAVELRARSGALEVRDHGPGLADGELSAVFERFHRGREGSDGTPGTGLGLPIARELARRWGGDVTLANDPDGGAVATITFDGAAPRGAAPRDDARGGAAPRDSSRAGADFAGS
jgi:two-component system sensor histidine kinase MprB